MGLPLLFQMMVSNFITANTDRYNPRKQKLIGVLKFSTSIEVLITASLRATGLERSLQTYTGMSCEKENTLVLLNCLVLL